ncbi:MAG: FISUMP domain-containing protein [Bacteroidota bacterium]
MKTFITAIIVILLMLLGFWYYIGNKCLELENANNMVVKNAVENAIDSVNAHYALNKPIMHSHVFPKIEKKKEVAKKKNPAPVKKDANTFTDDRDGQKYNVVHIAGQTWMAQNLNYNTGKSQCYYDETSNCDELGMLYKWEDASTACPDGWHLPDDAEWSHLINNFGGIREAGKHLKKGGDSGFNVLLAGYHDKAGFYGKKDESSYHWSSTHQNADYASFKGLYNDVDNVGAYTYTKADGFSVRCIKND